MIPFLSCLVIYVRVLPPLCLLPHWLQVVPRGGDGGGSRVRPPELPSFQRLCGLQQTWRHRIRLVSEVGRDSFSFSFSTNLVTVVRVSSTQTHVLFHQWLALLLINVICCISLAIDNVYIFYGLCIHVCTHTYIMHACAYIYVYILMYTFSMVSRARPCLSLPHPLSLFISLFLQALCERCG